MKKIYVGNDIYRATDGHWYYRYKTSALRVYHFFGIAINLIEAEYQLWQNIEKEFPTIDSFFIVEPLQYSKYGKDLCSTEISAAILTGGIYVFEQRYDQRELMRHLYYADYQAINGSGIYNSRRFTID